MPLFHNRGCLSGVSVHPKDRNRGLMSRSLFLRLILRSNTIVPPPHASPLWCLVCVGGLVVFNFTNPSWSSRGRLSSVEKRQSLKVSLKTGPQVLHQWTLRCCLWSLSVSFLVNATNNSREMAVLVFLGIVVHKIPHAAKKAHQQSSYSKLWQQ